MLGLVLVIALWEVDMWTSILTLFGILLLGAVVGGIAVMFFVKTFLDGGE